MLKFPGSATGPWSRYVHDPNARGIGAVRYPRLIAKDTASAENLQESALTNLYNERPTWLELAHKKLEAAVAYRQIWRMNLSATSRPPGPCACQTWPKAPAPSLRTST